MIQNVSGKPTANGASTATTPFDVFGDNETNTVPDLGSEEYADPFGGMDELDGLDEENPFPEDDADLQSGDSGEEPAEQDVSDSGAIPDLGSTTTADPFGDTDFADEDLGLSDEKTTKPKTKPTNQKGTSKKTSTTEKEDAAENPLEQAMSDAEQKDVVNAQKTLFEKSPVFKYGGVYEVIENQEQSFEELRVEKANEFPELDDGKKVSWTVEYGKISKPVTDPKGTTIGKMKKEIETSKAFIDALKKSKDKNPDCVIKPSVRAQTKGKIPAYKGIYSSVEEADDSGKVITLIPARDGKVYEMRKQEMGTFVTPIERDDALSEVKAGFIPALPHIPQRILKTIICFFRHMAAEGNYEALVNIYWDKASNQFIPDVPVQTVSSVSIYSEKSSMFESDKYIHYMDIHSHNQMDAFFSQIDNKDEKATRVYAVVGKVNQFSPEIKVRISNGGKYLDIDPSIVFEPDYNHTWPHRWKEQITSRKGESSKRDLMKGFLEYVARGDNI